MSRLNFFLHECSCTFFCPALTLPGNTNASRLKINLNIFGAMAGTSALAVTAMASCLSETCKGRDSRIADSAWSQSSRS